jgi:hypothetical protein
MIWKLDGLRPANHPVRRLAMAAHWLAQGNFAEKLDAWFLRLAPNDSVAVSFLNLIQVNEDPFWSWHWMFSSGRFERAQPLIGAQRATDLAINVVIPWLWIRAVTGKSERCKSQAEELYFRWPKSEDNTVLRHARRRLFGDKSAVQLIRTAADQQALLQIVHDFCNHSNALCENCQFPNLVRQMTFPELGS